MCHPYPLPYPPCLIDLDHDNEYERWRCTIVSACNGTIIQDKDMGEVIQLQGDHRTKVMDFLTDKDKDKMGKYALAKENIKVSFFFFMLSLSSAFI